LRHNLSETSVNNLSSGLNNDAHLFNSNGKIHRHNLSETFVDNLSLGLAKSLEKLPGVQVLIF